MADKKILDEELMSDEELEKVAGGNCQEMVEDSRFWNSLNGSCGRYDIEDFARCKYEPWQELVRAWASVGIHYVGIPDTRTHELSHNDYILDGHLITQEEARQHAMNVTGHHMNRSEWDY